MARDLNQENIEWAKCVAKIAEKINLDIKKVIDKSKLY